MKTAVYSFHAYEQPYLDAANAGPKHELLYLDLQLNGQTASLAQGCPAVSIFINDDASAKILKKLQEGGAKLLALRSAGFNHVDVFAAEQLGMTVLRVPAYSPYAVAEHAVALMLALNRKLHRAYQRVREQNFSLNGLMGFDMHGKTVGVVGTGKIGAVVCRILHGFGCRLLAFDPMPNPEVAALGAVYVSLNELLEQSDVVTLQCPLTPDTKHLINAAALARMKPKAMLINTSRGGIVDTRALIETLKAGKLGAVGLDVYEEEADLFFQDLSDQVIQDDVFARLLTFPNVLVTAHQGFFTQEAVEAIQRTTIENITAFERGEPRPQHQVSSGLMAPKK